MQANWAIRGRGATINPVGRFERFATHQTDDDCDIVEPDFRSDQQRTEILSDTSRSIIAFNDSPDVPFDQSINVYRGCEHGCIYCYARPTHNYLGLSSGLDFETKIFAKRDAAELLRKALRSRHYICRPLALGANTDPYQPIERRLLITRRVLEVLESHNHPLSIVTKSALVLRDLDVLSRMAEKQLINVFLSVTSLQGDFARKLEPRASAPHLRLKAINSLAKAGIPTGVMVAPLIPALNDQEIEQIMIHAKDAGATTASYTMIRLPHDVKELFASWLREHYPERRAHVLSLISQIRSGKLNDAEFGRRMRGTGPYAELIAQRFRNASRKLGLRSRTLPQRTDLFSHTPSDNQLSFQL